MMAQFVRKFVAVLMLALLSGGGAASADGGFVSGFEDLPLMPALEEGPGGAMVFDSPSGRIVMVRASGPGDAGAVRSFYHETLPQLGWTATPEGAFTREGEILRLEFPGGDGPGRITVRFRLAPL